MTPCPVRELTETLIRRRSVFPDDAGCQSVIAARLAPLGFECEPMRFGEVDNLWAVRRGAAPGPLLVFAGHTDVVHPASKDHPPTITPVVAVPASIKLQLSLATV